MASKQFFDPLTLLRLSPLIVSTGSLWLAYDQYYFLSIFNTQSLRRQTKDTAIVPAFFQSMFISSTVRVLGLIGLAIGASVANLYTNRSQLQANQAVDWYKAGIVATTAHLAFLPLIAPSVRELFGGSRGGTTVHDDVQSWLKIHAIRSLTVDVAAWGAFAVAASRSLAV